MIEPIIWEPYKGETVNTHLTIRGGKKYQETAYYEDRVNAVPRGNAYCIGNGPSRAGFDLTRLKATGQTYGCNALYRDFIPDFIFSIDSPITLELVNAKVYEKCFHYSTSLEVNRYPKGGPSHLHLIPNNPRWICGNQAFWTAGVHGHKNIYLIGYDFREYGKNKLNMLKMRPDVNYTVVHDDPPEYMHHLQTGTDHGNSKVISYAEFEKVLTPS